MTTLVDTALRQLDDLLAQFKVIQDITKHEDFSDQSMLVIGQFSASAIDAIERIAGSDSVYSKQARDRMSQVRHVSQQIPYLAGIVQALRGAVASGYLTSARELIHGEVFSDFLDMAEYLSSEGYKDAAAVIGGGTIEVHLRELCTKHGIALTFTDPKGQPKSKRAEQFNDDLKAKDVYGKLDHKNVTAWLDLRNKAAHAEYDGYTKGHVDLMLRGIGEFVSRYPA